MVHLDDGRAHLGQTTQLRRLQRARSDGQRRVSGATEVRHRRREAAVLPVQLEVSQHAAQQHRAGVAVARDARVCYIRVINVF